MDIAQQIATGGTFGLILALVLAVYGYSTGRVRAGSVVDADMKKRDANEDILRSERNEAIKLAQSYADQFERALDIIEGKSKQP